MAKVPVYDEQRVSSRPLATPQLSGGGGEFAQALGASLQQAGAGVARIAQEEQEKAALAQTFEAYKVVSDWKAKSLTEFMSRKGKDALGTDPQKPLGDKYLEDFDRTLAGVTAKMSPAAQRAFAKVGLQERNSVRSALTNHELQQHQVVAANAYEGALSGAISNAAASPLGPEAQDARKMGLAAIRMYGGSQGWPEERLAAEERGFNTKLHVSVLDRLKDIDPARAELYLAEHRAEIDGTHLADLDKVIGGASLNQRALQTAQEIMGAAPGDTEAQLAAVEKIGRADLQDEVRQRVEHAAQKRAQMAAAREVELKGRVRQSIERGEPGWRTAQEFVLLSEDGKADMEEKSASVEARKRGLSDAERRAEREEDQLALNQFNGLPDEVQLKIDLATYFKKASPNGLALLGAQRKRTQEDHAKGLIPERTEFDDYVKDQIPKGTNKKASATILTGMRGWRARWYQDHAGKGPSREDVATEMARTIQDVMIERRFLWDTSKKRYQVKPDEEGAVYLPGEPPPSERQQDPGTTPIPSRDAAPNTRKPRPSLEERNRELKKQGLSPEARRALLNSEGY